MTTAKQKEDVNIRLHSIIYKVEEEIRNSMLGLMEATTHKETVIGKETKITRDIITRAEGRRRRRLHGDRAVRIKRTGASPALIPRDNVVVFESNIGSLRRFKEDVSDVQQGYECGITVERFNDYKIGDVIEAFIGEKVKTRLSNSEC